MQNQESLMACPPESDRKALNDYTGKTKACVYVCARERLCANAVGGQVIMTSADSSLKTGMLRTLKARIDRIVHYLSDCNTVMRWRRKEVRARRESTYAKIMTAVTL